jgi:hypothetical protein
MSIEDQSSDPVNKIDYVLVHTKFMGYRKLSSFDDR